MIEFFFPQPQDLLPLRSGPLAPHLDRFATLLAQQGYCQPEGRRRLRLVADLSQWLAERRIKLEEFDNTKRLRSSERDGRPTAKRAANYAR